MKPPSTTVTGNNDAILIPPVARAIDWEGELAVVIGRKAKAVTAAQALRYVAGYTIMNDVSERDLLIRKRTKSRPRDEWFDWLNGKWLDGYCPVGPWIVPTEYFDDPTPENLSLVTKVNGKVRIDSNTNRMIHPIANQIAYISSLCTLESGDIVSTGVALGPDGADESLLQPGDVIEGEVEGIGTLRNTVGKPA
jgi:2-keto-4-pentenoate hydratase/2-oxohepta-3-ene-1,7-dioic acid hydratase in catechol pathway